MPNIDENAKAFERTIAGRVGAAVQARRKAQNMTAVQLSERTKELGYPITRVTITKIETNNRAGKLDVAEWLVLAAALNVPPALLLFPDYPDGNVKLLPEHDTDTQRAVAWLAGQSPLAAWSNGTMVAAGKPNAGTRLVEAVVSRDSLDCNLFQLQMMESAEGAPLHVVESTRRLIRQQQELIARKMGDLTQAKAELWRNPKDEANAVLWDQREDESDG
jgi:transcriptional regulator with XRE-family HTH domain